MMPVVRVTVRWCRRGDAVEMIMSGLCNPAFNVAAASRYRAKTSVRVRRIGSLIGMLWCKSSLRLKCRSHGWHEKQSRDPAL